MAQIKKITLAKVLEKLKIPKKHNLDIPRRNMPQIKGKHMDKFVDWLEEQGIKVVDVSIPVKDLKPTQKDFNTQKVITLMNTDTHKLSKPILVSKDNYIIDGHHKWLAQLNMDDSEKVKCVQVNMPVKEFLDKAKEFPKVRYKDLDDTVYKRTDPKLKYSRILKVAASKFASRINLIETKDLALIKEMAKSKSFDAHIDLARNKNTPIEVLWDLAKNKEDEVRLTVVSNPNITPQVLNDLAKDKSIEVREAVAKHPKTLEKTLNVLSMDNASSVRREADKRLDKMNNKAA